MNKKIQTKNKQQQLNPRQLIAAISKLWESYTSQQSLLQQKDKQMSKLRIKVNQLRQKAKPNINQQLIRREQDYLINIKKQLSVLKQQKQTLLKLQANPKSNQIQTEMLAMKRTVGLSDKIKSLKQQNRLLMQSFRQKQKRSIKQHSQMFQRRMQERDNPNDDFQTKTQISNMNKEIEEINNSKSQAQSELKKQLEQIELNYNKIRMNVEKKKLIYEEKMKQLSRLKTKVEQQNRIKLNLDKQKERERIRSKLNQRRKSLSLKKKNEDEDNQTNDRQNGRKDIERQGEQIGSEKDRSNIHKDLNGINNSNIVNSTNQHDIEGQCLKSNSNLDKAQRQSRQIVEQLGRINKIVRNKQLKNFNSIGIGTTFYYNDQYDKY